MSDCEWGHAFNRSTVSGSHWLVQHNLIWEERDICTAKRFTCAPFSLSGGDEMRLQICQMEEVTLKVLEDMALAQVTARLTDIC